MSEIEEEDSYEGWDFDEDHSDEQDYAGVCSRLQEAWSIFPSMRFGDFLNISIPGAYDGDAEELKQMLDEFILQNQ